MRLIKHPGRPTEPRRVIARGRSGGEWRIALPPGAELGAALIAALQARGVEQAALQLLSGSFDRLELEVSDSLGGGPAEPAGPRKLEGAATLVGGAGILGRDAEGGACLRCRATVVDRSGRLEGGALVPAGCRVGADGLVLQVLALAGAGFFAVHDAETDRTLLQPVEGT
ncbi:MAG: hypothetical protein WD341_19315 [Tistlia sp.]|uniref:hypothetical protein n=1 Tax=Tistlia sp. TaxID=3057121 RepID=UPI0034A4EEB8